MALSIHETKEQILANAYHLYPSHKYQNIILGTDGSLLRVRRYHAYIVANVCDKVHCQVSQHCSATSSMLITGLNSDTIGGAYTNLLDAIMCRCWKDNGQLHGDVQHIPGHGVQENLGPSAVSGLSSIGTAAASAGGNLGSAQRTAQSSRLFGSGALFGSGQRPQSIVHTFPTTDLSQSGQDNGVRTNGVNQNSGIHKHNGENNHRPSPYGGRFGNKPDAIGEFNIRGCEKVDCEVCSYLNGDLAQDTHFDGPHISRARGQGVSGHSPRSSTGLTFGTAARESMDSLKGSTGITFGTAAKSTDTHKARTGFTFGSTAKKSTDGPESTPDFSIGYAEKTTDAPKNSTGFVYTGFKPSTQDRSVAGQAPTGSGRLYSNDSSHVDISSVLRNICLSHGSGDLPNSVLDKQDAGDKF